MCMATPTSGARLVVDVEESAATVAAVARRRRRAGLGIGTVPFGPAGSRTPVGAGGTAQAAALHAAEFVGADRLVGGSGGRLLEGLFHRVVSLVVDPVAGPRPRAGSDWRTRHESRLARPTKKLVRRKQFVGDHGLGKVSEPVVGGAARGFEGPKADRADRAGARALNRPPHRLVASRFTRVAADAPTSSIALPIALPIASLSLVDSTSSHSTTSAYDSRSLTETGCLAVGVAGHRCGHNGERQDEPETFFQLNPGPVSAGRGMPLYPGHDFAPQRAVGRL